ncbi:MAG: GNAT family N-acetyltransferase [Burkholderiales bacterium]
MIPADAPGADRAGLHKPQVGVWRFMVGAKFQGQGIGKLALLRVIERVRNKGLFKVLELPYLPGRAVPNRSTSASAFATRARPMAMKSFLRSRSPKMWPDASIPQAE